MVAAIAILLTVTVIIAVFVPWILKAEVDSVRRDEEHVFDPSTPTVAYPLPTGVDVAVLAGAVATAGHAKAVGFIGGEECLVVECREGEREEVREVLGRATKDRYAGSGLRLGAVVFADER